MLKIDYYFNSYILLVKFLNMLIEDFKLLLSHFTFQDSEIARLQAKISGLERTLAAMRMSESFNVTTPLSDYNYSNKSQADVLDRSKSQGQNHDRSKSGQKEIILSDLAVTFPKQMTSEKLEIGQQFEIKYVKGDNSKAVSDNQENIEPSGPVRVLNFSDCDERNVNTNSGIHRPKPVLPTGVDKSHKELKTSLQKEGSKDTVIQSSKSSENQSAFSRISKRNSKEEKTFPGEKELGMYLMEDLEPGLKHLNLLLLLDANNRACGYKTSFMLKN